jgi:flagellar hook-associated protein 2
MVSPLATGAQVSNLSNLGSNTGIVPPDVLAQVNKTLQSQNTLAPKINAALAQDRTKLSGLGQLQSALANFQNVTQAISGDGLHTSANSSSSTVVRATGSQSAQAGTYNVVVNQLAQGQTLQTKALAAQDAPIGTGQASQVRIDFGSVGSGGAFVPGGAAKSVTINSNNNSLQGIASAINAADIGVNAKVVARGNQVALSLTGPSGANQNLRIAVNGDASLKNLLEYVGSGQNGPTQVTAAQNATFSVNGVAGSSGSNVVTNAITGTRLELTGKGSSSVVVSSDSGQVANNISNFVSSFNALNSKLRGLAQGDLKNEGSPERVQAQLARTLRNTQVTGADGNTLTLAGVGVTQASNGELTLDRSKLQAAIVADPTAVSRLFSQSGTGLADGLNSQIKSVIGSDGALTRETTAINKDISSLNAKKANLARALTAQANALVKQYSQQQNNAVPGLPDGSPRSLFDIIG